MKKCVRVQQYINVLFHSFLILKVYTKIKYNTSIFLLTCYASRIAHQKTSHIGKNLCEFSLVSFFCTDMTSMGTCLLVIV